MRLQYGLQYAVSMPKVSAMQKLNPKCSTKSVTFRLSELDFARLQRVLTVDALDQSTWLRRLVQQALDNRKRKP